MPSPASNTGVSQTARTTAVSSGRNLFSSSIVLAQYSFTLQLLLRVITFALNGLAFRHLDAGVLGIVNFRLGLYYSTLVFAARESFRRACLSRGGELLSQRMFGDGPSLRSERKRLWYGLLNVMWLTVPAGFLMIIVLLPIWLFVWPSPTLDKTILAIDPAALTRQYTVSALVYSLSALFELATEPLWLVCQLGLFVRSRIALEAIANISRAIGIVLSVIFLPKTYGLYLLACPQILHGITLLIGYVLFFTWVLSQRQQDSSFGVLPIASASDLLPNFSEASFDRPCLRLSWGFFRQGILKQFLTEGERYLISAFHLLSFSDQGIYDLVNNLGSIVPRMLFSPIEESCHLLFSQCVQREQPANHQNEGLLLQALSMLRTSLRLNSLLAWIGFVFSQAYSRLLLFLYGGSSLVLQETATELLRLFSLYLIFLAWNGPTEAFLNAAMNTDELNMHNRRLTVFSVIFLTSTWLLVPHFGASGFILANCINMLARVAYSCFFIHRFMSTAQYRPDRTIDDHRFHGYSYPTIVELRSFSLPRLLLPSKQQAFTFVLVVVATLASEKYYCAEFALSTILIHVTVGAVALLVVFGVIIYQEHELVQFAKRLAIGGRFTGSNQ
uniref:Protein RFT1 homolog n=2 Tax=Schistocephalus solidus TaxID=70667 RepID=A0A0X3PMV2_SCHSO